MKLIDQTKKQVVTQIVKNLHKFSDENLIRLSYLAEELASDVPSLNLFTIP